MSESYEPEEDAIPEDDIEEPSEYTSEPPLDNTGVQDDNAEGTVSQLMREVENDDDA